MKGLHMISFVLVIIGGLNWGLVGLAGLTGATSSWNVVDMILGQGSMLAAIVYVLVGLAAIVLLVTHKKDCRYCNPGSSAAM